VDHESSEVCLVFYTAPLHEAGLVWVDEIGGNSGEAVGEDMGEYLVVSVKDGDGVVVTYLGAIIFFVNQAHPAFREGSGFQGPRTFNIIVYGG